MAALASLCLTAKQTECSELAWLIMMTFTLASRTVVKMALATPCGTIQVGYVRWKGSGTGSPV